MSRPERSWPFPGGLKLDEHKAESTGTPIRPAPVPAQLVYPLQQHIGAPARPQVQVGDRVLRGQLIAAADGYVSAPVHAASSGTVSAIEARPVPHPSGLSADCIVIDTDGRDEAVPAVAPLDPAQAEALEPAEIRERVRAAGIVGLGGAAFPSFIKLNPGCAIDTLILNGAECEPYISCDQMLMAESAETIVAGARIMMRAIGAPRCVIGVEDNKPESIRALRKASGGHADISVHVVPTRYPPGGEKQLIMALTGREVPSEGLPLDIGIVCHNVGTAVAVHEAIVHGRALTERVVTVTGAVAAPANFRVRLGTPVAELLAVAGGRTVADARLIMGGPMMGFELAGDTVPVIKATNCLLTLAEPNAPATDDAMPCIRCGACVEVCPAQLLPQQLYWHARAGEYDDTQRYGLFDCIECGCCAQVCPSHLPLVQFYRNAKTEIWAEERARRKADAARERHESRQQRLEREAAEREAARAAKKAALKARQAAKAAASDDSTGAPPASPNAGADPSTDPVAAAIEAAKRRKAARDAGEDS